MDIEINRTDKRTLYQLMGLYVSKKIPAATFCDEFYYCFDIELDHSTLTVSEMTAFSELDKVSSRFSPYQEDHGLDPKAFATEEELSMKIVETIKLLESSTEVHFKEIANNNDLVFRIEGNMLNLNTYLYVLDSTHSIIDYYKGDILACKQFALKEYGVPLDTWKYSHPKKKNMIFNDLQMRSCFNMLNSIQEFRRGHIEYNDLVYSLEGFLQNGDFPDEIAEEWYDYWAPLEIIAALTNSSEISENIDSSLENLYRYLMELYDASFGKNHIQAVTYNNIKFEIKRNDSEIEMSLYISDNDNVIFDYTKGDILSCKQFAQEKYGVPLNIWKESSHSNIYSTPSRTFFCSIDNCPLTIVN